MKRSLVAVVSACLLLVGCGGHSKPKPTLRSVGPVQTTQHCTPSNEALQCVLATLPAPPRSVTPRSATFSLQGVDFAWTKISPSAAGSFGASYLSNDPSKDWNPSLISAYHAAGKGTVAVFETTASRSAQGCAAGAADARFSEGLLSSWGYPHSHFDMATDFDATGAQVAAYYRCAAQAEPGLVGAYAGYRVITYLCANHITTLNWQTYAWSGGLWADASCAPLEQYLNGATFDHDRAIAANYGQFPSPKPPPPPGPSDSTIRHWQHLRNVSFSSYRSKRCVAPQAKPQPDCSRFAGQVTAYQKKLWTVPRTGYKQWPCFGPAARRGSLVCWIVRPEANWFSRGRALTQKAENLNGCNGPVGFPKPSHSRLCRELDQRDKWFDRHATAVVTAFA